MASMRNMDKLSKKLKAAKTPEERAAIIKSFVLTNGKFDTIEELKAKIRR
jgi:hypothetical protein